MNIVMMPSVSGGMGHIARTATLARMLVKLDPSVNVEFVLDTERMRAFNIEACQRTGFKVSLLAPRLRDRRDAIVKLALKHADVIVDDTQRHLIPLRYILPQTAWVSIPMYPLADELFGELPHLEKVDKIIWAYPPVLDFPEELEIVENKVLRAGPFFEMEGVLEREAARESLGIAPDETVIIYAPRGMSFGREFGEAVLAGVYGAVKRLRRNRPNLRLILLAVNKRDEIYAPGVPARMPEWVTVKPFLPPIEMLNYIRAADIAVTEGSNMTQEAMVLGTPILMIPGTIYESWLLGTRLSDNKAAQIIWIELVTVALVAEYLAEILDDKKATQKAVTTARKLVTGSGGVEAAARAVLEIGKMHQKKYNAQQQ